MRHIEENFLKLWRLSSLKCHIEKLFSIKWRGWHIDKRYDVKNNADFRAKRINREWRRHNYEKNTRIWRNFDCVRHNLEKNRQVWRLHQGGGHQDNTIEKDIKSILTKYAIKCNIILKM